jgi:competence protein ComFC
VFSRAIQTLRDGVLSLAYPQECRICSQPVHSWNDGVVCHRCWNNPAITKLFSDSAHCIKCHAPLPASQNFSSPNKPSNAPEPLEKSPLPLTTNESTCSQCQHMPFTFARACGAYAGALEANVLFLKSQPHVCRRLRDILLQTFAANEKYLLSDVVIPVPLHSTRRLERGFNQAQLLATIIASHFNLQLDNNCLQRSQNTERHRAGMDAFDRMKSVKTAFQVVKTKALQNTSVLLIDDVFTTGSTLCAVTRVLLEAGAAQVRILTLAKVTQARNRNHM